MKSKTALISSGKICKKYVYYPSYLETDFRYHLTAAAIIKKGVPVECIIFFAFYILY